MTSTEASSQRPSKRILLINGPNLNLLGAREPGIYGSTSLTQIEESITKRGKELDIEVSTFQSNYEGAIIDTIHSYSGFGPNAVAADSKIDGIIINPAAFTHTSVAIRDALLGVNVPFVEIHISNVHAREAWRHHSYFSDKAAAIIVGLGVYGYVAALEWWHWRFNDGATKGI